jgi:hypothetical protein
MRPLAIIVGLALLAAAGCSSGKAEGEKPLTITVREGGCYDLDGRNLPTAPDLLQAVRDTLQARTAKPSELLAVIRIDDPAGTPYRNLARAILVCGYTGLDRVEVEGVPVRVPSPGRFQKRENFKQAFSFIEIRSQEDLDRLRSRADLFKDRGIMVHPRRDTPTDRVIAAMRLVHEAGGVIGLEIPWDDPGDTTLTLNHEPADQDGFVLPVFIWDASSRLDLSGNTPIVASEEPEGGPPPKIVYVVDASGSMGDLIDLVKYELKQSVSELTDDYAFHVIFFGGGPPQEMPARRLVPATERRKVEAFEFIDSIVPEGQADPTRAFERAFDCKPDIIYFLTDGDVGADVADFIRSLNIGKKVTVHVYCFGEVADTATLKRIAAENGGLWRAVTDKELENLAR